MQVKRSAIVIALVVGFAFSALSEGEAVRTGSSNGLNVRVSTQEFVGRLGDTGRTLTVISSGGTSGEYLYTWQHDDNPLPDGTTAEGPVLTFGPLTFEHAGEYSCTVTDMTDPDHPLKSPSMHVSVIEELPAIRYQSAALLFSLLVALMATARVFRGRHS